jgi:N-acetylmuramoyl-L-alanine amidase CwlA|tara:strand:+ start:85 stop:264 length:180 start_codon:yes stop_codon:yes gene_type:complete
MKHKSMSQMNKEKGRKWDGKTRPATELYRKRWNEIFNNTNSNDKRDRTDKISDRKESDV